LFRHPLLAFASRSHRVTSRVEHHGTQAEHDIQDRINNMRRVLHAVYAETPHAPGGKTGLGTSAADWRWSRITVWLKPIHHYHGQCDVCV
jgi:hypothetical protein